MRSHVDEIAPETYRISTFHPEFGIQFNQFLIVDDEPFLMHTGMRRMFDATRAAVASVIDPATVRWIGYSHFEADECGALNEWLAAAPRAQAACSVVGAMVNLADFADRPARGLADDEVLDLGRHRLRFLATPHLPHGWDAGLFFDATERTLLCSDLFFQPGDPAALTESDLVGPAREAIAANAAGPLANDVPYTPYTARTFARLATLAPTTLATMHGSSFRGAGGQALTDLATVVRELLGPRA
jgi:flavorubredoxin